MVCFLKNVFPRYLWRFFGEKSENFKGEEIVKKIWRNGVFFNVLLKRHLYQNGKAQNMPVVAGRFVHNYVQVTWLHSTTISYNQISKNDTKWVYLTFSMRPREAKFSTGIVIKRTTCLLFQRYRDGNVAVKYFTSFLEIQITFLVKESLLPINSKIESQ